VEVNCLLYCPVPFGDCLRAGKLSM